MQKFYYDRLEDAINNNELTQYLVSDLKYIIPTDRNFDMRNDYKQLVINLNFYGKEHENFDSILNKTLKQILNAPNVRLIDIYSVASILVEQINLEKNRMNLIEFIDDNLLNSLRDKIYIKYEDFKNLKRYEGSMYSNGMIGAYEQWNNDIFKETGKRIL